MGVASSSAARRDPNDRPRLSKEEVAFLPLVPHSVYAALCEDVYQEPTRRPLPDGWRVLMTCDEMCLNREGYYAAAYVNNSIRHCIIAERGTSDALGIRAGVWMYFDEPTIQFALAEQFSKLVRLRLALGTPEASLGSSGSYVVSYAGHSLGAVLAACRAVAEHTFAVTFESPGCKTFIEKTMFPFRAEDVDIVTYLRPPNPINTLKPQAGYLLQLPTLTPATPGSADGALGTLGGGGGGGSGASAVAAGSSGTGGAAGSGGVAGAAAEAARKATSAIKQGFSLTLPNPQEYLRSKLLERAIPELQTYLGKVEPILKELLEHTQQVHSISIIVDLFQSQPEPAPDVVLVWPSHLMQFLEVFNITRAMEDPTNQVSHVYAAYESLLNRLYLTAKRPRNRIALRFLNRSSRRLARLWYVLPPARLSAMPLSLLEQKVLNTTAIEGSNLISEVLTALQIKQFLAIVSSRPEVQNAFDAIDIGDTQSVASSKL